MALNWTQRLNIAGNGNYGSYHSMCIDASNNIYLFVNKSAGTDNVLYKSTNGGDSWTNKGAIVSSMGAVGIYFMENVLYAGIKNGNFYYIYTSIDGGDTWNKTTTDPLQDGGNHLQFFVADKSLKTLYVTYSKIASPTQVATYSTDYGVTWNNTNSIASTSTWLITETDTGKIVGLKTGTDKVCYSSNGTSFILTAGDTNLAQTGGVASSVERIFAYGYAPSRRFAYSNDYGATLFTHGTNFDLTEIGAQIIRHLHAYEDEIFVSCQDGNYATVWKSDIDGSAESMEELTEDGDFGDAKFTWEIFIGNNRIIALSSNADNTNIYIYNAFFLTQPIVLTAIPQINSITLNWTQLDGIDSYDLYWSLSSNVTKETGKKITGVSDGHIFESTHYVTHYFIIYGVVTGEETSGSNIANAIPLSIIEHPNRLLEQYKPRTNINKLINSTIIDRFNSLEAIAPILYNRLNIDASSGMQLDKIGTIVGQDRLGHDDVQYRMLLKAKIGTNNSRATIETIVSIWKIMTQASYVWVQEIFPGQINIFTDVALPTEIKDLALALIQQVVGAGIKVGNIAVYDPDSFGFGELFGGFGSNWIEIL